MMNCFIMNLTIPGESCFVMAEVFLNEEIN